jgi:hypothetical protein
MAKTSAIVLTCDLPPDDHASEGSVTVEFGYKGKTYEVELCPAHLLEYDNWMSDYVNQGAREVSGGRGPRSRREAALAAKRVGRKASAPRSEKRAGAVDTKVVRTWAQDNGYDVATRGRLKPEILEAYERAQ